jgi:hypothetical protein
LDWAPEWARILGNHRKSQNSLEETSVSIQATREYLALIWAQYQGASKQAKSRLLDEIEKNTGMHRKAANRLMRGPKPTFRRGRGESKNKYSENARRLVIQLWKDMGRMGARRMKAGIVKWLSHWNHSELDDYTRHELLCMSETTIERCLLKAKAQFRRQRNTGTKKSSSKAKVDIPQRELGEKISEPGHCEIDCVAHCGGSLSGEHVWTLTLTDIATGYTEEEAIRFKNGYEVVLALSRIEDRLPFSIIALYMDNGSEFINEDMIKRFSLKKIKLPRERVIQLFRSRAYKKNDQCHVEQKNFTHVRELFGYDRYEGRLTTQLMNAIYRNEWRLLANFFHPQIRLIEKYRIGSKLHRKFAKPRTAFEQLLPFLDEAKRRELTELYNSLNPFELRKKLKRKLRDLKGYNSQAIENLGKEAM